MQQGQHCRSPCHCRAVAMRRGLQRHQGPCSRPTPHCHCRPLAHCPHWRTHPFAGAAAATG
eukprot:11186340-Lingulodinium_polyedra.AAC.1